MSLFIFSYYVSPLKNKLTISRSENQILSQGKDRKFVKKFIHFLLDKECKEIESMIPSTIMFETGIELSEFYIEIDEKFSEEIYFQLFSLEFDNDNKHYCYFPRAAEEKNYNVEFKAILKNIEDSIAKSK